MQISTRVGVVQAMVVSSRVPGALQFEQALPRKQVRVDGCNPRDKGVSPRFRPCGPKPLPGQIATLAIRSLFMKIEAGQCATTPSRRAMPGDPLRFMNRKNHFGRKAMVIDRATPRGVIGGLGALVLAAGLAAAPLPASAQSGEPIKIGFSLALTGRLAPNGKQALLGAKIWEEEINAKGGLLGRKVELVNYDDQSNPANIPGIYTKLLDVDKVDLVNGPYGTNLIAPALPVVMQKNKILVGLFGLDANKEFHYTKYFSMISAGPKPSQAFTEGYFQVAALQKPKPETVALAA